MKKRSVFPIILKSLALFCAIAAAGGFCKSFLMRECSNIAKELKKAENDLRALNRENDFWDAEIAKVHAPAFLRSKAGAALMPPAADRLVLAYQITEILPDGQKSTKRLLARRQGSQKIFKTAQR